MKKTYKFDDISVKVNDKMRTHFNESSDKVLSKGLAFYLMYQIHGFDELRSLIDWHIDRCVEPVRSKLNK